MELIFVPLILNTTNMKSFLKSLILFAITVTGVWTTTEKASAQVSVSFQVFYDDLSPYGYWVDNPSYGYVWVPNVSPGFTPYGTNGHWVYTDAGWTWFSDYSWGWAPFHYGRWYSDPMYGPMWVPGNEWGPGWVTWRRTDEYYGWAPIEPGISISMAYSSGYRVADDRYTFVRNRDFGSTTINNYYVNSSNNTTIINNSTVINNTQVDGGSRVSYNAGPDRMEVQKRTGATITPVALKESSKPGQTMSKGELQTYRPRVEKNNGAGQIPAPSKVADLKDVKPASQRNSKDQSQKQSQPGKEQPRMQQPVSNPAQEQRKEMHAKPQDQPKQQPSQQQHHDQPGKQQPVQQRQDQPKQQQQRHDQPANQQPAQQQHRDQPQQQPSQQQRRDQPARQQPPQQQHHDQPSQQQPSQQHQDQPKQQQQQQQQQQRNDQQRPSHKQDAGQPKGENPHEAGQPEKHQPVDAPKNNEEGKPH